MSLVIERAKRVMALLFMSARVGMGGPISDDLGSNTGYSVQFVSVRHGQYGEVTC